MSPVLAAGGSDGQKWRSWQVSRHDISVGEVGPDVVSRQPIPLCAIRPRAAAGVVLWPTWRSSLG
jgi:hypothetical protein